VFENTHIEKCYNYDNIINNLIIMCKEKIFVNVGPKKQFWELEMKIGLDQKPGFWQTNIQIIYVLY